MSLAVAPRTSQIQVAVRRSETESDIYSCNESNLECVNVIQVSAVSEISIVGRQILAATSSFADNKKECILTIDPMTRSVSHDYCSPSTGVHYAVAVINNRYVAAFTGISKRAWFSEYVSCGFIFRLAGRKSSRSQQW